MPESPVTSARDLIDEVGRSRAVLNVLRITLDYPLRRWPAGLSVAVGVLFA